jgi:hypothetical protein
MFGKRFQRRFWLIVVPRWAVSDRRHLKKADSFWSAPIPEKGSNSQHFWGYVRSSELGVRQLAAALSRSDRSKSGTRRQQAAALQGYLPRWRSQEQRALLGTGNFLQFQLLKQN